MARAAGFASASHFERLEEWQHGEAEALGSPGPRFIVLAVETVGAAYHLESPGPVAERIVRFREALAKD